MPRAEQKNYFRPQALTAMNILGNLEQAAMLGHVVEDAPQGASPTELRQMLRQLREGQRMPVSTVFHHIDVLQEAHLVTYTGRGALVFATDFGRTTIQSWKPLAEGIEEAAATNVVGQITELASLLPPEKLNDLIHAIGALRQSPRNH